MRTVILSDIHANFQALTALDSVVRDADLRICLGDIIGYYCEVNEAIDYVRAHNFLCVRGNHDDFLIHGYPSGAGESVRFGIDFADRIIDPDHRKWLGALPLIWGGFLQVADAGDRSALLCHGSPWDPLKDYLYEDASKLAQLASFSFDLICFGQTHRPLLMERGSKILLNPGSVGQSRHRPGVACAAVTDADGRSPFSMIEVPYDVEAVSRLAVQAGAGDWISKHLRAPGSAA